MDQKDAEALRSRLVELTASLDQTVADLTAAAQ
jgi:hypothetical protein